MVWRWLWIGAHNTLPNNLLVIAGSSQGPSLFTPDLLPGHPFFDLSDNIIVGSLHASSLFTMDSLPDFAGLARSVQEWISHKQGVAEDVNCH